MGTTNPLHDPGLFSGNLHQLAKDFGLIILGLEGLSLHAKHEEDITIDQIDSIIDYAYNLHGKLCVVDEAFPEMIADAQMTAHSKGGSA